MGKVAYFNLPAHGHINPTLPLVQALIQQGEQVRYYNFAQFREKIEASGATFVPYPNTYDYDPEQPNSNVFGLAALTLESALAYLPTVEADLRRDPVDYILYDSLVPWGKFLGQRLGLPYICTTSTMALTGQIPLRYSHFPDLVREGLSALPLFPRFLKAHWRLRQMGVAPPGPFQIFSNPAPLTLVFTSREFQPLAHTLPTHYRFVGPQLSTQPPSETFPLNWLDEAPVIYISLGTLFNNRPDFYQACIQAFGNTPYRVVISIGQKLKVTNFDPLPDNIRLFNSVPQVGVLSKTTVFITHGGFNSVSEALYFGVPMLIYPQIIEQGFTARRVVELGAGLRIDSNNLTPGNLRPKIEQLSNTPSFRQAAMHQSHNLQQGGPQAAVSAIFEHLTQQQRSKNVV